MGCRLGRFWRGKKRRETRDSDQKTRAPKKTIQQIAQPVNEGQKKKSTGGQMFATEM